MLLAHGFLVLLLVSLSTSKISQTVTPKDVQSCYNSPQYADTSNYVGSMLSWICDALVTKSRLGGPPKIDAQKYTYITRLLEKAKVNLPNKSVATGITSLAGLGQGAGTTTPQPPARCVRKEYRMLTDSERQRYHNAINALKNDMSVAPNRYDAIAEIHALAIFRAHFGPAFCSWHTLFINMYEAALQEKDPSICLPYWDSSIDDQLKDPTTSQMWTDDFMGNPQGPLVSGPFAGWLKPDGTPITRAVGQDGQYITYEQIAGLLSKRSYEEILSPSADPQTNFEFIHGGPHVRVGGDMSFLNSAAYDPCFFLHHGYVDYLLGLIRANFRSIGVNPEIYPNITGVFDEHLPNAPSGFGNITQAETFLEIYRSTYVYQPSPTCTASSPDCGSKYLACNTTTFRCYPIIPGNGTADDCPALPAGSKPIQNNYCVDKTCDINQWVTIPVQVVTVRPPDYNTYASYPVYNVKFDKSSDVYFPKNNAMIKRYVTDPIGNPKTFERCPEGSNGGDVFVTSTGINYGGFYKEHASVDYRYAVSYSIGYVAVKKPANGQPSTALIRAHDSCGRVCRPACKDPDSKLYRPCSGAISVSTDTPLQYGNTYGDAILNIFNYKDIYGIPQFTNEIFFLTFYCDYSNKLPYNNASFAATARY